MLFSRCLVILTVALASLEKSHAFTVSQPKGSHHGAVRKVVEAHHTWTYSASFYLSSSFYVVTVLSAQLSLF
jgi:hypothetical protein